MSESMIDWFLGHAHRSERTMGGFRVSMLIGGEWRTASAAKWDDAVRELRDRHAPTPSIVSDSAPQGEDV